MKMVLSSKGSSIDRCSSSSTVSGGNNGPETISEVLKQLKVQLGRVNLFEALDTYFTYGYGIKILLKKFDVFDSPNEVVNFLLNFGPFFDHIITYF